MAINITVSNHVGINVKGVINDEEGKPQPFSFWLRCKRLKADEIKVSLDDKDTQISDFMRSVIEDWKSVQDGAGGAIAFSAGALNQLFEISGVAVMAFRAYLAEVGAREKN